MTPLHCAAALLIVTIWGEALRALPCGESGQIPSLLRRAPLR
jgi:hypothetical protein